MWELPGLPVVLLQAIHFTLSRWVIVERGWGALRGGAVGRGGPTGSLNWSWGLGESRRHNSLLHRRLSYSLAFVRAGRLSKRKYTETLLRIHISSNIQDVKINPTSIILIHRNAVDMSMFKFCVSILKC